MDHSHKRLSHLDFKVDRLGECYIPSPIARIEFIDDASYVLYHTSVEDILEYLDRGEPPPAFEKAGARRHIYFDPRDLGCGIVTCGGLCPGLNNVIRAIVLSLHYHYGVSRVYGFRYGYEGLVQELGHKPMELTPEVVSDIHQKGGTILGSSRGPQDVSKMVDTLEQMRIGILFTIGGDGTLKGAQAIAKEIARRGLKISVIGIPKTIDNDISFIQQSFGFETAVSEAVKIIAAAHSEAIGARNGIGLVKLMGRESGFIAAMASLANNDVNFCLIPEVPVSLKHFLEALRERLVSRGHAVIVVGEGVGKNLIGDSGMRDPSGNIKFPDVGVFLKDQILSYFNKIGMEVTLKYIDPSYTIRSLPANSHDSAMCLMLAHKAVHAGMSGRTNMVVGTWNNEFTHVPISLAVSRRKRIDPNSRLWHTVVAATGQPPDLG